MLWHTQWFAGTWWYLIPSVVVDVFALFLLSFADDPATIAIASTLVHAVITWLLWPTATPWGIKLVVIVAATACNAFYRAARARLPYATARELTEKKNE